MRSLAPDEPVYYDSLGCESYRGGATLQLINDDEI